MPVPPVAKKDPTYFENHGINREDNYYWLRDFDNPEVQSFLAAENDYYDKIMAPLSGLVDDIYNDMVARIPEHEDWVPIQNGDYFYYWRQDKDQQYPVYARKRAQTRAALDNVPEEVILDENALANSSVEPVETTNFLSVGSVNISNNQNLLAYSINRDGSERYAINIKDLGSGRLLDDVITGVRGGVAWSADDNYIFYVTENELRRTNKLWRHKIGTPQSEDVLLYEEPDPTFYLGVYSSRSKKFIFAGSGNHDSNEYRIIDAENPLEPPRLFQARQDNVRYQIQHWKDNFIVLTDQDAPNFKLLSYPLDDFANPTELLPYDEHYYLNGMIPFRDKLYITGRADGQTQIWRFEDGKLIPLQWDEEIYNVSPVGGQSYEATELITSYESYLAPLTYYSINLENQTQEKIQQKQVYDGYQKDNYIQERIFATAADGTQIPILIRYRRGARDNGPAPLVLYAYGGFDIPIDPAFSAAEFAILDRGVILATAQVRGGSEYGRWWREGGRLHNKRNTFTDFIACAQHLIDIGYTKPEMLAGRGRSGGGGLICSVANLSDELFQVLVADVPVTDLVTTLLDPTIHHSKAWHNEWGNPEVPEDFEYILSHSAYDNLVPKEYPAMYVTGATNDSRVNYWEPAKYVAKLRELKTDDNTVVLKTNMGLGHFGASGRNGYLHELAQMYAYTLSRITDSSNYGDWYSRPCHSR